MDFHRILVDLAREEEGIEGRLGLFGQLTGVLLRIGLREWSNFGKAIVVYRSSLRTVVRDLISTVDQV